MLDEYDRKRIVAITRPFNRVDEAVKIVESNGAEAFVAPTLELKLTNTDSLKELVKFVNDLDWLIFTSPTSIESIFKFYPNFKEKVSDKCQIATIGHKTEEIANDHGLVVNLVPENYTAEGLLESFENKNINLKNIFIGIPRTLAARLTLPDGLKSRGANVFLAESYKSIIPSDTGKIELLIRKILNLEIDAVTFTSPLTVKNLFEVAGDKKTELVNKLSTSVLTVSIGPITKKTLEKFGVDSIYPENYTVKDMMDLLFENL